MEWLEKKLVAGYDIQKDNIQLSFYMDGMADAETVSLSDGQKITYEIPFVIACSGDRWLIGDAAYFAGKNVVKDLLFHVKNQEIQVLNHYSAEELLEIFLQQTLLLIPHVEMIGREIDAVCVALREPDKELFDIFFRCFERIGIREERIYASSIQESAACYAMSRQKELWNRDVIYFDFTREHFLCWRFFRSKEAGEMVAQIEEKDKSSLLSMELLETEEGRQKADQILCELSAELLQERQVSCVYLTGEGFCQTERWAVDTLKYICSRKRVFLGMNLYTKGAAILAYERNFTHTAETICMRMKGCVPASVSVYVCSKGEKRLFNLVREGSSWYHANAVIEGILDECRELTFFIKRNGSGRRIEKKLKLSDFPYRERRMTRIELSVTCPSEEEIFFQITDLGFGQYAQSSGAVIQKKMLFSDFLEEMNQEDSVFEEEKGKFILCSSKRSHYPYEIKMGRIALYSLDELCYYLYHNVLFLQKEFFDKKLIAFLRDHLEQQELADKIEYTREEASLEELVMMVMNSAGYYEETELKTLEEKLNYFGAQSREMRLKMLGDLYLDEGRPIKARGQYYLALQLESVSSEPKEFFGKVLHNMAMVYMEMFFFEEAVKYLKQAYEHEPQTEYLRKILFVCSVGKLEEEYNIWKEKTEPEQLLVWENEWKKQREQAKQMEEYEIAAEAVKQRTEKNIHAYEELAQKQVSKWIKEYRDEMGDF